jgi:hypothetical protein
MRVIRWSTVAAVAAAALTLSGAAQGVGPWPGLAAGVASNDGQLRYTATRSAETTVVRAITRGADAHVVTATRFDGRFGVPAVTSTGIAGGLSPNGRLLALSESPSYTGLRTQSTFLIVQTPSLRLSRRIVLRGEFGFDTFSRDGRWLYVLQHRNSSDLAAYVVRAYDLVQKRLLPGAIVAKGESENMRGYPVSRATRTGGRWVYTLYTRMTGQPFVHALNTDGRYAICIDLPTRVQTNQIWETKLGLSRDGRKLLVRSGGAVLARVDTRSFRVT